MLHLWESTPLLLPELPPVPLAIPKPARGRPPAAAKPATLEDHPLHPALVQPLPEIDGGFGLVMADPAWKFRSWVANANPESDRSAERHYRTMTLEEIAALPVKDVVARDAHLMMWITMPFLVVGAHIPIMRAWGFKPSSSAFVWMKLKRSAGGAQMQFITLAELPRWLHTGMGHTTRKNAEICVLGRRGNAKRLAKDVLEPIIAPVREHSRKPDEAYERAQRYAAGPFLELFSREDRDGWTTWGNETGKLNGKA